MVWRAVHSYTCDYGSLVAHDNKTSSCWRALYKSVLIRGWQLCPPSTWNRKNTVNHHRGMCVCVCVCVCVYMCVCACTHAHSLLPIWLYICNVLEFWVSTSFSFSLYHSHTHMHTHTASDWLCAVSTLNKNWHKQLPYSQQLPTRWSSSIRYSEHNSTVGIRFNFLMIILLRVYMYLIQISIIKHFLPHRRLCYKLMFYV